MQILYIFSTFQTRQGQYIIHHNTWPHPQLLALTLKRCKCFIEFHFTMLLSSLVAFVCAYGPVSCLSCLPAQVPEASHIHFIPYAHCKRSVSTPAYTSLGCCKPFSIRSCPKPSPTPLSPSAVLTMWQWHFIGTLDKHPELDAGFLPAFICCLSLKRATMLWCHLTSFQIPLWKDGKVCQLPLIDWKTF